MLKKILLIGNGAREHVIAETLKASSKYDVALYVVGKSRNPGIMKLAEEYMFADLCDIEAILNFAAGVDDLNFAVIGPEAPIEAGLVDALEKAGVSCASPLKSVGRLESSKGFTRDLLNKYEIPGNPKFKVFDSDEGLEDFFEELGEDFVVKADGLKGGKGVKVSGDHLHSVAEGLDYARECLADAGRVVIEEKFVGQEFSLMSFCDGENTVEMPPIQDHKRAFEGDLGPNTGGMGTYSGADGLPFLRESDLAEAAEITRMVALALKQECGVEFKGVMYGGFIAVRGGVRLIEYNARFGDPEAMNALILLENDFVDVCEAIIEGSLDKMDIRFKKQATVCKYVVPNGYPDAPVKGEEITIGDIPEGVKVYYASVDEEDGKLSLCGSRAVAFVATGDSIEEAEAKVARALNEVEGPVFYRKDIGTKELVLQRVEALRKLRA